MFDSSSDLLLIGVMALVLGVLVIGIITMMRGGDANRKYAGKLMWLRVGMQATALILLAILYLSKP